MFLFTLDRHFSVETEESEDRPSTVTGSAQGNRPAQEDDDIAGDFQAVDSSSILDHNGEDSAGASAVQHRDDGGDVTAEEEHVEPEDEEETEERKVIKISLPPHRKCATHRLNLVATSDVAKLDGALKKTSVQTFAKLSAIWNKQNRSTSAANTIKAALGTLLITPGDTRWNSYYDSVARVNSIVSTPSLEPKFDVVCDELQIKRLLPSQKRFISEYVQVMKPVCDGLDKLQGDTEIGQGYLLPTLYVMTTKLEKLLDRHYDTDGNPLPPN